MSVFFAAGLRPSACTEGCKKAMRRQLAKLAKKARVPFSGWHLVCETKRAQGRLAGLGITLGAPIPKALVRTLVASGMRPEEARKITWKNMW